MQIDFLGGSYAGRSKAINCQETINFYPEFTGASDGAKTIVSLIGTPGFLQFAEITGVYSGVRALYVSDIERFFCVAGNKLVEFQTDGTYSVIGKLNTDSGPVSIAENRLQMIVVDGTSGYLYEFSTGIFKTISTESYQSGTHVVCNNGFFVQNVIGKSKFIFSGYQNGEAWDELDFYDAESSSDYIRAIGSINGELWLFGGRTIEPWYNKGGTIDDPTDVYARVNNGIINIGVDAPFSVAALNNNVFWLGSNTQGSNIVWAANGYTPQRISNHAIEYIIGQMGGTSDAIGYCYQQEGHSFYVLTFFSGNRTLVYDMTTGQWHERGDHNKSTGLNDCQRISCCAYWNHKTYTGDYRSGKVYEMNLDYYDDCGDPIQRRRIGGHIHSDKKRMFFRSFEIDLQHGVATTSGQGQDPRARLQWSDDGAETWSNEYWGQAGKIGEYKNRMIWYRLGQSRDRVFMLTVTDPVKWVLVGANAKIEVENG